jgi:hypothetical protein
MELFPDNDGGVGPRNAGFLTIKQPEAAASQRTFYSIISVYFSKKVTE